MHELLQRGVEHRRIRETIGNLRDSSGNAWPLTHGRLSTSGGRVVAEEGGTFFDIDDIVWHQLAIEEKDVRRIAADLHRGGWAARDLSELEHIEVDPARLSGRPVIRGTRVPAELVAELAKRPGGREELREDYDVTDVEIDDAVDWWRAVRAYKQAA